MHGGPLHHWLLDGLLGPLVAAARSVLVLLRLGPAMTGRSEHLHNGRVPSGGLEGKQTRGDARSPGRAG
ncbi:hypothetical protein ACWCPS_39535 [Streptomyces mauvecolor]